MPLDLNSLRKASASLANAITVYDEMSDAPVHVLDTIKAGVVQNFEFTYELSWKFMKRWIENNISHTIADGVTRRELFRLAAESRLIFDVDLWMEFHSMRNISSHTYNIRNANNVLAIVQKFLDAVIALLHELEDKNS